MAESPKKISIKLTDKQVAELAAIRKWLKDSAKTTIKLP